MKYLINVITKRMRAKIVVFLSFFWLAGSVFAATKTTSIGDIANTIFNIGMNVREIVRFICIVAGVSLILGSLLQYKKYRQNPVETRLSTVIFTFVAGVCLIALSFIPIQI